MENSGSPSKQRMTDLLNVTLSLTLPLSLFSYSDFTYHALFPVLSCLSSPFFPVSPTILTSSLLLSFSFLNLSPADRPRFPLSYFLNTRLSFEHSPELAALPQLPLLLHPLGLPHFSSLTSFLSLVESLSWHIHKFPWPQLSRQQAVL